MRWALLFVLLLLVIALVPVWPHSLGWGLFPSGLLLSVFCIILLLMLFSSGRVPPL